MRAALLQLGRLMAFRRSPDAVGVAWQTLARPCASAVTPGVVPRGLCFGTGTEAAPAVATAGDRAQEVSELWLLRTGCAPITVCRT